MNTQLIPHSMVGRVAQRFKILSEPVRLELLDTLQLNGELSVQALVDATGHRQANVSKHLNLMAREGVLNRRKEGLNVFYSIEDPSIQGLCLLVCGRLREEAKAAHQSLSRESKYAADIAA